MSDDNKSNLPALTKQVGDLVLAGSLQHAEEALSQRRRRAAPACKLRCNIRSRRLHNMNHRSDSPNTNYRRDGPSTNYRWDSPSTKGANGPAAPDSARRSSRLVLSP